MALNDVVVRYDIPVVALYYAGADAGAVCPAYRYRNDGWAHLVVYLGYRQLAAAHAVVNVNVTFDHHSVFRRSDRAVARRAASGQTRSGHGNDDEKGKAYEKCRCHYRGVYHGAASRRAAARFFGACRFGGKAPPVFTGVSRCRFGNARGRQYVGAAGVLRRAGIGGGGSLTRIFRFRRGVCVGRAISIFGVRRSAVVFYQFVFFFFRHFRHRSVFAARRAFRVPERAVA